MSLLLLVFPPNDDISFSIGRTSGELAVSGTLDRETLSRYIITVDVSISTGVVNPFVGWNFFINLNHKLIMVATNSLLSPLMKLVAFLNIELVECVLEFLGHLFHTHVKVHHLNGLVTLLKCTINCVD